MNINDIKKTATDKMAKSVETLKNDLGKVRTGRAHAGIIDHVKVDYYGAEVPVKQVANVTLADSRTISVQPFEKKMVQAIEKAIRDSDLGVNPATSGDVIRIPMPALTEERRRELTKIVKHEGENAKVAVRNIRRDAINHLKELLKKSEVSEDEEKRATDEVQKLTDKSIADIDKLVAEKERELMAV
ncbi:MAG TPA: ribosome recycling factor [Usitatibacter sp.]|jgi:ribosome recycling factor|nr:ribosome recycling factor [Usitatibacter sp.]